MIKLGLFSEVEFPQALAECRNHLRQPDTSFTMYRYGSCSYSGAVSRMRFLRLRLRASADLIRFF